MMCRRDLLTAAGALGAAALVGLPLPARACDLHLAAALDHLMQDEKLARDLYTQLSVEWGLPVFANIAASEQRHMDAVAQQLRAYGLQDPTRGLGPGELVDGELQEAYFGLLELGLGSVEEALLAGAMVEDLDIHDLDKLKGLAAGEPALLRMVEQLRCASENHMRAFVGQLQQRGVVFTPSHISQAELGRILAAPQGGCGGGGKGRGRGQGGGQGRRQAG